MMFFTLSRENPFSFFTKGGKCIHGIPVGTCALQVQAIPAFYNDTNSNIFYSFYQYLFTMLFKKIGFVFFAFFLISVCIAPVIAEELTLNENMDQKASVGDLIFGFAKPKWTYNGDDWKLAGDQYKESGNFVDALHAYDKSLENYGMALKDKEVEWSTKDARYNKQQTLDVFEGLRKQDMTPIARENIRTVLASKERIYKKTGDNAKALDCVNTLLEDEPTHYNLLKEKVDLLKKLGRTAEAAEVQKLADANKPQPTPKYSSPDLLMIIGAIAGIFLIFRKKRS